MKVWKSNVAALTMGSLLMISSGCSEPAPTDNTSSQSIRESSESAAAVAKDSLEMVQRKLTGVWMGGAAIDQAAFEATAAKLTQRQQEDLLSAAQTFISTAMAVDFRPDGTMETAVEITPPGGAPVSGATIGTWRVTGVRGDEYAMEVRETLPDGSVATSEKLFSIVGDNQISMTADTDPLVGQCGPRILLDRQVMPSEKVAQGESATVR